MDNIARKAAEGNLSKKKKTAKTAKTAKLASKKRRAYDPPPYEG